MAEWNTQNLPPWPTPLTVNPRNKYVKFQTQSGPGKTRPISTVQGADYSFTIRMDGSERATLMNLYNNNGAEFTHNDPRDDTPQTFRFIGPPQGQIVVGETNPYKRQWNMNIQVERLP